jgi:phosphoenolpyruvate synthase/pyruvate phosphate dikinase
MAITPLKFTAGIALVAVPLFATTMFCRPSFANAINNHLLQEELEAKRQHNYKTDFYEKDEAKDKILADYAIKGKGKARVFTPNH